MWMRRTPQFKNHPHAIAELEKRTIGGIDQWLLIRGTDCRQPILLFLHGGPGTAQIGFAAAEQGELEKHYVAVNWDQRGAGLSYTSERQLAGTMTLERFIADLLEVVQYLLGRFGQEKLFLVGHSWGTILGTLFASRYPQYLHAYIGVGQIGHMQQGEQVSYDYVLRKAEETGNRKAQKELAALADRPFDIKRIKAERKWLSVYGGVTHNIHFSRWIAARALRSPTYTATDFIKFMRGANFSLNSLWDEVMAIDLFRMAPRFKVPVWFFTGRYDYNTPFSVAERYFAALEAPRKEWVWFEHSAHAAPFEEPEVFAGQLIRIQEEILAASPDEALAVVNRNLA